MESNITHFEVFLAENDGITEKWMEEEKSPSLRIFDACARPHGLAPRCKLSTFPCMPRIRHHLADAKASQLLCLQAVV